MRQIWFAVFLLLSATLHIQSVGAATLHAFLIGDTDDEVIGLSVKRDLKNMSKMLDKIVKHTNLDLHKMCYDGNSAKASAFLRLKTLDVGSDDVVLFFIASHGYLTDKSLLNQILPYAEFTHQSDVAINIDTVANFLKEKKPRLLIGMADVCSNIIPFEYAPPYVINLSQKGEDDEVDQSKISANYTRLFEETSGVILISGASPGQSSCSGDEFGGVFTCCFLESLKCVTEVCDNPSWEDVRGVTLYYMYGYGLIDDQVPYFEIRTEIKSSKEWLDSFYEWLGFG